MSCTALSSIPHAVLHDPKQCFEIKNLSLDILHENAKTFVQPMGIKN
jgi:hypothetical protein